MKRLIRKSEDNLIQLKDANELESHLKREPKMFFGFLFNALQMSNLDWTSLAKELIDNGYSSRTDAEATGKYLERIYKKQDALSSKVFDIGWQMILGVAGGESKIMDYFNEFNIKYTGRGKYWGEEGLVTDVDQNKYNVDRGKLKEDQDFLNFVLDAVNYFTGIDKNNIWSEAGFEAKEIQHLKNIIEKGSRTLGNKYKTHINQTFGLTRADLLAVQGDVTRLSENKRDYILDHFGLETSQQEEQIEQRNGEHKALKTMLEITQLSKQELDTWLSIDTYNYGVKTKIDGKKSLVFDEGYSQFEAVFGITKKELNECARTNSNLTDLQERAKQIIEAKQLQ